VIVFSGGTKDTGKNNSKKGLRNILSLVKTNIHTNIDLLTYRIDTIWKIGHV
jgi:hypothetical protein